VRPVEIPACMGMDAFRLCVGKHPRNFTAQEVLEYLESKVAAAPKDDAEKQVFAIGVES